MKKISYCLLAMVLFTTGVNAQVTIGSGKVPESFSALEVVSNNIHGFRLPRIETTARRDEIFTDAPGFQANNLAQGLQIFNMETRCVETWNGTVWIQSCSEDGPYVPPLPPAEPILLTCGDQSIAVPEFMAYNLGADPSLDTPKKQMAYLASAEAGGGTTTNVTTRNGRVFGGRYQWGRKNHEYAINADYILRDGTKDAVLNNPTYDDNGQILTNDGIDATDLFIKQGVNANYDWALLFKEEEDRNHLWGNGTAIGTPTNTLPGGITYNSNTYQSPVRTINDPCPTGWRVPTQDEWERIGNYNCMPNMEVGNFSTAIDGTTPSRNPSLTWVPVVCGGAAGEGKCIASNTWGSSNSGINTGYAVYKTEDWTNRTDKTTEANLISTASPEPFLFLPSAGLRNAINGRVSEVGHYGAYWSSTIAGVSSRCLRLSSSGVAPSGVGYERGVGMSVRCVANN